MTRRRILRAVVTVLLLSAAAVFSTVLVVATLYGCVHSLYYVPDSAQIGDVLLIALLMVSTIASVVLAPPPRRRPSISRARAPRLDERVVPGRPAVLDGTAERGPGPMTSGAAGRRSPAAWPSRT